MARRLFGSKYGRGAEPPNDRRVKTLSLTDAGRAAQHQAREQLRVAPKSLLALSTSELRTLRDLMAKCWEQAPGQEG
jgi:DNA-binding MarR family transcriptional regulator